MTTTTHGDQSRSVTLVTRALDAVDRAHARAATVLHDVRNDLLHRLVDRIERAELRTLSVFERARNGVDKVDAVSADVVNRAQGVVGHAIEKARVIRSNRLHVVS